VISANIAIKTIIIVPVKNLVVMVVLGRSLLRSGYVVRNQHAVFRTEPICQKDLLAVTLTFAMVRTLLGIMERTTTVVLVSVAIGRSTVLVILRISVATAVSNESSP
jgi:hypothetical protein